MHESREVHLKPKITGEEEMEDLLDQAGVDEAGCGALIGDLVAAAVILPEHFDMTLLADSKKLTPARRARAFEALRNSASIGIGIVTLEEINTNPFGWARRVVFQRALDDLVSNIGRLPASIVVDGTSHFFDGFQNVPFECKPKADATHAAVSAASIVAKETRDASVLLECDRQEEMATRYAWRSNKGYPSAVHRQALREHGLTPYHRIHFGPCRDAAR